MQALYLWAAQWRVFLYSLLIFGKKKKRQKIKCYFCFYASFRQQEKQRHHGDNLSPVTSTSAVTSQSSVVCTLNLKAFGTQLPLKWPALVPKTSDRIYGLRSTWKCLFQVLWRMLMLCCSEWASALLISCWVYAEGRCWVRAPASLAGARRHFIIRSGFYGKNIQIPSRGVKLYVHVLTCSPEPCVRNKYL